MGKAGFDNYNVEAFMPNTCFLSIPARDTSTAINATFMEAARE
jgi:hypothetical protein